MKIDKLIKEYNAAMAGKESLANEVERLRTEKINLTAEAEAAAKAGDVETYKQKRDAASLAADNLFVKEKQIEGLSCLRTEDEAKDAWKEFAEDYNKSFGKAWKAYEAKRKDLYNEFLRLVDMQNAMLKKREACGDCCGLPRASFMDNPADRVFPIDLLPISAMGEKVIHANFRQPDVAFFFSSLLAGTREASLFNQVIRLHMPCEE